MPHLLALASLLATGAVRVSPDRVPAHGAQEAILTLDHAAMIRLTAESAPGTACELVDQQRGTFARSGVAGGTNCVLEELLDAGTYKVRLRSPDKAGPGEVKLQAAAFTETSTAIPQLVPGRTEVRPLHPGEQATFAIHLASRQAAPFFALGRTVGRVELWRNGEWLEPSGARDVRAAPRPGQGIHRWFASPVLEPGDYLLTLYGVAAEPWTRGQPDDTASVTWGVASPVTAGSARVTLPSTGFAALALPKGPLGLELSLASAPEATLSADLVPVGSDGQLAPPGSGEGCTIAAKQLIPVCTSQQPRTDAPGVVMVTGAPGTVVDLAWGKLSTGRLADGEYATNDQQLVFTAPQSGTFLVASHDLPPDADAAPLGCQLERVRPDGEGEPIADAFPRIDAAHPLRRAFNYARSETLWFELGEGSGWTVSTSGERRSHCELFRFEGTARTRVAGSEPRGTTCKLGAPLPPGKYELRLTGGVPGIEKLTIAARGSPSGESGTQSTCRFPPVRLEAGQSYRIGLSRTGHSALRGLTLRPLPLALQAPLRLRLERGERLELPLAAGEAFTVQSASGGKLSCTLDGQKVALSAASCAVPRRTGPGTLAVSNAGDDGIDLVLEHELPPPTPLPALATFVPRPEALPQLVPERPLPFDFERTQARSMVFDVPEAGLYDVTTEGLLSTACTVRTPVVPELARAEGGGRGRNCLVAGYLRPGRYMLTAATVGASRGHGAVVLRRRGSAEAPALSGGDAFFPVAANQLIRETIRIAKGGRYQLTTYASRANLRCRLEDADGWPLGSVPSPCSAEEELASGTYRWLQLPLTVDSTRRTTLAPVQPPQVLEGPGPHEIEANREYQVRLGRSGTDELRFQLQADLDVHVRLTNGMTARIVRLEPKGPPEPVAIVPPELDPGSAATPQPEAQEVETEGEPPPQPEMEPGSESVSEEGEAPVAAPESAPAPIALNRPHPSPGFRVHLRAGRYALLAQHARGDVHIEYAFRLGVDELAPGVALELDAPASVPLHLPHAGTVRLETTGNTDVRCRIFDARGHLLADSRGHGADWNCALAERLPAGDHHVVIESETLTPGPTRVSVTQPPEESVGALHDGQAMSLKGRVVLGEVPAGQAGTLTEVLVRAKEGRFSCTLEAQDGTIAFRRSDGSSCMFILKPQGAYRLRLWSLEPSAAVTVSVAHKSIEDKGVAARLQAGRGARVEVPFAGHFRAAPGLMCLPEKDTGVFASCGPDVSLEAGPTLFAALGPGTSVKLELDEKVARLEGPAVATVLGAVPRIERARTSSEALQLARISAAPGEVAVPACRFDGGVRRLGENGCFAASPLGREATLRSWVGSGAAVSAAIERLSLVPSVHQTELLAGPHTYPAGSSSFRAPAQAWRATVTAAPGSWVVQLDAHNRPVDLCPPAETLSSCTLEGQGGRVLLRASSESQVDIDLTQLEQPVRRVALVERFEQRATTPGQLRLEVAPAPTARTLRVEGNVRCEIRLDDGSRLSACVAPLPAGTGAEVAIDHGATALRALAYPGDAEAARFGAVTAGGDATLPTSQAVPLVGATVTRAFTLERERLVRLQSTGGVCGLVGPRGVLVSEGLGDGCDVYRLLPAGIYRLAVRPFADMPLVGSVSWSAREVESLGEGVGPERWLAPGEERIFAFNTRNAGQVGIGLQVDGDTLECRVVDAQNHGVGEGCQEFLNLAPGRYLLAVRAPAGTPSARFRPVVLGLTGGDHGIPAEYLRDFFQRIGGVEPTAHVEP